MSTIIKTQHVRCPSIRELYTMMQNGQPINAHFHRLFDAPECDLDDDRVIMCPDNDDVTEIIQAHADQLLSQGEEKLDEDPTPVSEPNPESKSEPVPSVPPVPDALQV